MADYIEGVKIAELPEASSMSDDNLVIVEDDEATKQAKASMLKDYTNAELLTRIADLENQVSTLNTNLSKLINGTGQISSGSDLNDYTQTGFWRVQSDCENSPLSNGGILLVFAIISNSSGVPQASLQIMFSYNGNSIYERSYWYGTQYGWYRISTTQVS